MGSYKRVKGISNSVDEQFSTQSQNCHVTSKPSLRSPTHSMYMGRLLWLRQLCGVKLYFHSFVTTVKYAPAKPQAVSRCSLKPSVGGTHWHAFPFLNPPPTPQSPPSPSTELVKPQQGKINKHTPRLCLAHLQSLCNKPAIQAMLPLSAHSIQAPAHGREMAGLPSVQLSSSPCKCENPLKI